MTYNYGPLAAKAVALIAKFGTTVIVVITSDLDTPADAAKPWRGPDNATSVQYTPKGVVSQFDEDEVNGETVLSTDLKLLIAGQDAEMLRMAAAGHSLDECQFVETQANGRMAATNLQPVVPGDTMMLYTVRLRRP